MVLSNSIMAVLALLVGVGFIAFAHNVLKNTKTQHASIMGEVNAT